MKEQDAEKFRKAMFRRGLAMAIFGLGPLLFASFFLAMRFLGRLTEERTPTAWLVFFIAAVFLHAIWGWDWLRTLAFWKKDETSPLVQTWPRITGAVLKSMPPNHRAIQIGTVVFFALWTVSMGIFLGSDAGTIAISAAFAASLPILYLRTRALRVPTDLFLVAGNAFAAIVMLVATKFFLGAILAFAASGSGLVLSGLCRFWFWRKMLRENGAVEILSRPPLGPQPR